MDSKLLVLAVVGCCFVVYALGGKTTGKFTYNGRQCTWKELGAANSHQRILNVGCKGNKKKNIAQVSCQYSGDPHPCPWYNKNQVSFYACLANNLAANPTSVCNPGSVSCHNHCQNIVFNKVGETIQTLTSEMQQEDSFSESDDSIEYDWD